MTLRRLALTGLLAVACAAPAAAAPVLRLEQEARAAIDDWQDTKAERCLRAWLAQDPTSEGAWLMQRELHEAHGEALKGEADLAHALRGPGRRVRARLAQIAELRETRTGCDRALDLLDSLGREGRQGWSPRERVELDLERAAAALALHDRHGADLNFDQADEDLPPSPDGNSLRRELLEARFHADLERRDFRVAQSRIAAISQLPPQARSWLTTLRLQAELAARRGERNATDAMVTSLAQIYARSPRPILYLRVLALYPYDDEPERLRPRRAAARAALQRLSDPLARAEQLASLRMLVDRYSGDPLVPEGVPVVATLGRLLPTIPPSERRFRVEMTRWEFLLYQLNNRHVGEGENVVPQVARLETELEREVKAEPSAFHRAALGEAEIQLLWESRDYDRAAAIERKLLEQVLARSDRRRWEQLRLYGAPQELARDWLQLLNHRSPGAAYREGRLLLGRFATPGAQNEILVEVIRGAEAANELGAESELLEQARLQINPTEENERALRNLHWLARGGPAAAELGARLKRLTESRAERARDQDDWASAARLDDQLASEQTDSRRTLQLSRQSVDEWRKTDDTHEVKSALLTLSDRYEKAGLGPLALEAIEEATVGEHDRQTLVEYQWREGRIESRMGLHQKALERLQRAEALAPDTRSVSLLRQDETTEQEALGHNAEALELYRWRMAHSGAAWKHFAVGSIRLGHYEEKAGQLTLAEADYRQALADSKLPEERIYSTLSLGIFLHTHGRPKEADALAQDELARVAPGDARLENVLALWAVRVDWLCQDGKLDEARSLVRAAESDPVRKTALRNRAAHSAALQRLLREQPAFQVASEPASTKSERARFFEASSRIRRERPEWDSSLLLSATSIDSLARRLAPDQLLLGYFPTGQTLYILGVDREGLHVSESELEGSRLEGLCRRWHAALEAGQAPDTTTLAELQSQLVNPIQDWLKARPRLLLSLTGELWYVPLETMLPAESQSARLTQGDLLRLAEGRWHPYRPGPSLALGAPENAHLEGARRELETVAQDLPGCQLLTGNAATREQLLDRAGEAHVIHLASHSISNDEDPLRGYLALADGPLTLTDIYGLQLDASPVVVLSSCCSALGQDDPGSEPVSLATAFSAAGAGAVVSALWQADDQETRELFTTFYAELRGGASPGLALSRARAVARKQHPGSSNWSAFVLNGCPD